MPSDERHAPRLDHADVADTVHAGSGPDGDTRSNTSPELVEGTVLDGAYRVIRRIGGGAMGTVYLVEHTHLGRRFAAKVVAAAHGTDAHIVARLRNEARIASSIQHENLVDVTHLGQTADGALFVVMELLEGNDLRHRLTEQSKDNAVPWLPDDETRRISREVLAGLHAAHEVGVIHRDLKPDNIYLARTSGSVRTKIVDFGLSKIAGGSDEMRLTRTGQIMGTPLYMAPEQTRGLGDVDRRADIYAMGVILYEMSTGRMPFEATTIYDLIVKHATEIPPGPRTHRADLPEAVEAVIMRCLEKDPGARFQTAHDLLTAWESAWSGAAENAPSPLSLPRPPRRTPARAWWWLVPVVSVVSTAIAIAMTRTPSNPTPSATQSNPTRSVPAATRDTGSAADAGLASLPLIHRCSDAVPAAQTCEGVRWCDREEAHVGCCAIGLVAVGEEGMCGCAPGGTTSEDAIESGCLRATNDSRADVRAVIHSVVPAVRGCYEQALAGAPRLHGRINVAIELAPDGRVYGARLRDASLPSPDVQRCVLALIRELRFAPPVDGSMVINYPFGLATAE